MDGGPYKDSATKKIISGRNIYSVVAMSLYVWMKFHQGPRGNNESFTQFQSSLRLSLPLIITRVLSCDAK